ncbi:Competence protein CoiA-like family protein [Orenia metallireducens]|uniref:Competence protein CoiA-like family protein n=1 Tax=Orenia metallireducens TaxID=1413210 RepID=A0A285HZP4_9FIRM|nr:competence protein CoiA family protein [Orenia metallireducens]SNY41195.1 Competence protein CoiA-like family protein [Orenia metallireducens]
MNIKLPFGLRDGVLIDISELTDDERGLKCNCICPHCKDKLIARMGEKKVHHFAHYNLECEYALESSLHIFAKQVLEKKKKIRLPKVIIDFENQVYGRIFEEFYSDMYIDFDQVYLEKRINDIIPDVILVKDNVELLVEIKVTHKVDEEKLDKIKKLNISTIEIDLFDIWNKESDDSYFNKNEVRNIIIHKIDSKEWLYNIKAEERKKELLRLKKLEEERRQERIRQLRLKEELNLEKKKKRIEQLLNIDYQKELREKWDKNIRKDERLLKILKELKLNINSLPNYLNKEIEGEIVFNCDRRLWQTLIFRVFIYKRLSKGKSPRISVQHIVSWVKKKPYPLPLNWELVYLNNMPEYSSHPDLSEVIFNFLEKLVSYGFLEVIDYGGHHYYTWYERIEENLKILPHEYQSDSFIEEDGYLINQDTGEVIGKLSELYK